MDVFKQQQLFKLVAGERDREDPETVIIRLLFFLGCFGVRFR